MKRIVAMRGGVHRAWLRAPILVVVWAVILGSPGTASRGAEEPPPAEDSPSLRPGDRGYGLTVFSGTELDRFDVEIVGVMRNTAPGQDFILARLSGHGLEETGVVAGMSGSPVFVEDELVGAVAFSWPFSREAIAGITPIGSMRQMTRGLPDPPEPAPRPRISGAPGVETLIPDWEDPEERLLEAFENLSARLPDDDAISLVWSVSGFDPGKVEILQRALAPVSLAGEALPGEGPPRLEAGSAVAAVLVDGDLKIAATGTVTDRIGDQILAYGHSFLGLGEIRVPMAEAEVVTVLSNQLSSFKIANFGRTVGAFEEDRQVGLRGRIGADAGMIPLLIGVEGGPSFRMELARIPEITPVLVASSMLGVQSAAWQAGGALGLDLKAEFDLGRWGELSLAQSFDGDGATTAAALYLLTLSRFFLQNSFAEVPLEGIRVRLDSVLRPRTAVLVGGYAERTEVRPGERVVVHLDLIPYRGEPVRHELSLTIPADLPAGPYHLLVGDGVSMDALRGRIERVSPVRFGQALEMLQGFHSRRELVALGVHRDRGLAVAGEILPRLPGSIQAVWAAAASKSATPLALTVAQERSEWLDFPIQGSVRIDLVVKRRIPVSAEDAGSTEEEDEAEEETSVESAGDSEAPEASTSRSGSGDGDDGEG
ncbi:MAG: SpoIVB peptidase S55 domain-containing protein [Thermoanaerobaculia bacterium]|nr:SpoIVB peptidase S55 domain-containing protein [Thermoanaerobaculia bacterium]